MSVSYRSSTAAFTFYCRCRVSWLSMSSEYALDGTLVTCRCFRIWMELNAIGDVHSHMMSNYGAYMAACRLDFLPCSSPYQSCKFICEPNAARLAYAERQGLFSEKQKKTTSEAVEYVKKVSVYCFCLHCMCELTLPSSTASLSAKEEPNGQLFASLRASKYAGKHFLCRKPLFSRPWGGDKFHACQSQPQTGGR